MTNEDFLAPEPSEAPVSPAERRGAERFPCSLQPFWSVVGEEQAESPSASVRDVSATGIGLIVGHPIKPGTVLVLRLQTRDQRLSRPLPARVMHSTARPDGDWLVGCQFVRRLTDEDMWALLSDE
jgi:hypothetical protein